MNSNIAQFFAAVGAYATEQIAIINSASEWEIRPPVLTREEAAKMMEESIQSLKEELAWFERYHESLGVGKGQAAAAEDGRQK